MSGVRMLHFLKDWWKFIQIHQTALRIFSHILFPMLTEHKYKKKTQVTGGRLGDRWF